MRLQSWTENREVVGTGLSIAGVLLILLLHYSSGLQSLGLHDFLRRLFYIPIITAAIAGGRRSALIVAAVAIVSFIPHLFQLAAAGDRVFDSMAEFVLLPIVGFLVGRFADSSRRARLMAAERGRLAALGEVATALMAQVQGPLASIGGQIESLRFLADRTEGRALGFIADVIGKELARTRRFLLELGEVGRPAKRNVTRVDLSALLVGIAREIRGSCPSSDCLALNALPRHVIVAADRGVLSCALRSLLLSLQTAVPGPGKVRVGIREDPQSVTIEVTVMSEGEELPGLERTLSAVFGPGIDEYNFRNAIWVHLLKAEGASLSFQRVSEREGVVRVRFVRARRQARLERWPPTFLEAEAWLGSAGRPQVNIVRRDATTGRRRRKEVARMRWWSGGRRSGRRTRTGRSVEGR